MFLILEQQNLGPSRAPEKPQNRQRPEPSAADDRYYQRPSGAALADSSVLHVVDLPGARAGRFGAVPFGSWTKTRRRPPARMQRLALALLLAVAVVFLLARTRPFIQGWVTCAPSARPPWSGLADWFAVTALFGSRWGCPSRLPSSEEGPAGRSPGRSSSATSCPRCGHEAPEINFSDVLADG
jgi:hypothetical protein